MQNKVYKFIIYSNKSQQELINKMFGYTKFVFNHILSDAIKYYKVYKKSKINTQVFYNNYINKVGSITPFFDLLYINNTKSENNRISICLWKQNWKK